MKYQITAHRPWQKCFSLIRVPHMDDSANCLPWDKNFAPRTDSTLRRVREKLLKFLVCHYHLGQTLKNHLYRNIPMDITGFIRKGRPKERSTHYNCVVVSFGDHTSLVCKPQCLLSNPHISYIGQPNIIYKYHHSYKAIPENIMTLLSSVLLRVCSTSNNANGNKRLIFFRYSSVLL